jgi:hypothetical protein
MSRGIQKSAWLTSPLRRDTMPADMGRPLYSSLSSLAGFGLLTLSLAACEPRENPYKLPEKKSVDVHKFDQEMTPEELAEARKAAGHDSMDEIAAENAKMFEKGAREYIKTRLPEYRDLLAELRKHLEDVEKQAPKWKDDAAFAKFNDKYKESVKEFLDVYDELTGKGVEGGNTQADIGWAIRAWEALNADLGPGVAENEQLPIAIKDIRDRLDKVDTALNEIEQDETLEINPLYKPAKKKKK